MFGGLSISSIVVNHGTMNLQTGSISMRGLANAGTLHNAATGTLTAAAGTTITVGDPSFTSVDTMINDGTFTAAGRRSSCTG